MEIRWSPEAQDDILNIAEQYDQIDSVLANEIVERVEQTPVALLDFPQMGSPVSETRLRKWRVRGTPYLLLYRITPIELRIVRVIHAARDWQRFV